MPFPISCLKVHLRHSSTDFNYRIMNAHRRIFKSAAASRFASLIAPSLAHVFIILLIISKQMSEKDCIEESNFIKNRPLEKVFRNCNARVLDFFVLNRGLDYSALEISNITHVPLRSIQRSLPHLVKCKLVKEGNKVGNSRMYLLDESSELARLLTNYVDTSLNAEIRNARKSESTSYSRGTISLKSA